MDLATGEALSIRERERLVDALRPSASNVNRTAHPPPLATTGTRATTGSQRKGPNSSALIRKLPAAASTTAQSSSLFPLATESSSGTLQKFRPLANHSNGGTVGNVGSVTASAATAQDTRFARRNETNVLTVHSIGGGSSSSSSGSDEIDGSDNDGEVASDGGFDGNVVEREAQDAVADADTEGLLDDLMASTGLPRHEVELLLMEFRAGGGGAKQRREKPATKKAKETATTEPRAFFVTETPEPGFKAAEEIKQQQQQQQQLEHGMLAAVVTPRSAQQSLLDEFLPPPGGLSTSHHQTDYDAEMARIREKRAADEAARRASVTKYLERQRGAVDLPASLTDRNVFVEKHEAQLRARQAKEAARREEKARIAREERRQRQIKGFFSNMAIREKIELAQKRQLQGPQHQDQATTVTIRKGAANGKAESVPAGGVAQQSTAPSSPRPGDVAPFVSDDCAVPL